MSELKKYIKDVLNDALLYGDLQDGEKLMTVLLNKDNELRILSDPESENMIKKLQEKQKYILERRKKLQNFNLIKSIGEYIQLWQEENEVNDQEITEKIGIDFKEFNAIQKNLLSPINIDTKIMSRVLQFFRLKFEEAKALIEKTYFLFNIQLSSKIALSRYDLKKSSNHGKSMKSAIEELLTKANQKEPFMDGDMQNELQNYLQDLKKYWEE